MENVLAKMSQPRFYNCKFLLDLTRFIFLNVRRTLQRVRALIVQKCLVWCCLFPLITRPQYYVAPLSTDL